MTQGRNLRREGNIPASKKVKFVFKPNSELAPHDAEVLKLLLNAESLEVRSGYAPKKEPLLFDRRSVSCTCRWKGLIDVEVEKARLSKEIDKAEVEVEKVQQKLNNPQFVQKVPPNVLAEHQKRLAEWKGKKEHLSNSLAALSG